MILLLAGLAVLGASLGLGHVVGPEAGRGSKAMAGAVAGAALVTVALRCLALAGQFNRPALLMALGAWVAASGALWWRRGRPWPAWERPQSWVAALPWTAALAALAVALTAAALLPIWQWDALGYHLPFVQLVLQDGSMAHLPPGAEYIDTYPHGVELIFTAWRALLPDDTWVDAVQVPFGLLGAAATAGVARRLGAARHDAWAAAALWLLLPAVFLQLPSNYVDVATAAYFLLAAYWVLAPPSPRAALLCGLALGLLIAAKPSTPPSALLLGAVLLVRLPRGQRRWALGAAGLALLVGGEAYIRNALLHGNPVWPVAVGIGPWRLPGTDVLENMLVSGAAAPHLTGSLLGRVVRSWCTVWAPLPIFDMRVGGWGPLFVLLVPLAVWGARRHPAPAALAVLGAAVATPDPAVARYVLAMPALLLAWTAVALGAVPPRWRWGGWAALTAVALVGWWHCLPGLTDNQGSLMSWMARPAAQRQLALGPEGPTGHWHGQLGRLQPGEAVATDGVFGLPYLLWRSDARDPVLWLPAAAHGEALNAFLTDHAVRLLVAGDATPAGDVARAQPQRFKPLFHCQSDPCMVYWVSDAPTTTEPSYRLAVTFDDLPGNPADLQTIAATLHNHGLPPVYGFVNGQQLEGSPEKLQALKDWLAASERVGNHTYSHANLAEMSVAAYLADVRANEPLLASLSRRVAPWRVFRYPYLREGFDLTQRHALRQDLQDHAYRIAQVSADTLDFLWDVAYRRCREHQDAAGEAALRAAFLRAAAAELEWSGAAAKHLFGRPIAQILLAHSRPFTAAVLSDLLDMYRQHGSQFISLDDAIKDPVYQLDPAIKTDGDNFLEQLIRARHDSDAPVRPDYPRAWVDSVCRGPSP